MALLLHPAGGFEITLFQRFSAMGHANFDLHAVARGEPLLKAPAFFRPMVTEFDTASGVHV